MRFVRAVWKLLVGIKDALVLLLMLLFFGVLYAGLSAGPRPLGDGVLMMAMDGRLVEQPSRPGTAALVSGASSRIKEFRLADMVDTLDAARDDSRVKAVALDLDSFLGGGQTAIATLGEALDRVRKSGKPVLAFATGYTDDGYQLAAHATEVWMSPLGAVAIAGPGGSNLYFKGLFDKLGVTAHVFRVGTYKSAVEPFILTGMSPAAKENATALDQALLSTWTADVDKARPQAAAGVAQMLADPAGVIHNAGGDFTRAALGLKLIDRSGERQQFQQRLAELGGRDTTLPGGYRRIALVDYVGHVDKARRNGPIGIVTIAGTIIDGRAGPGTAGGETIARAIEKGVASGKLKALVVRVDSPGGSVTASERIRQAILGAKASGLPVVVSMGNVAASGGYWVSTPASWIFAEPSTITGSIGVFGIIPSFEGSLAKLGITTDGVRTTPLSGQPDVMGGLSPQAEALIQAGVESSYRRFLAIVGQSRHRTPQQIDTIAQGRVWDGGTARQLGLVDQFGGLDDAIAKAAALANLGDERGITRLESGPTWEDSLVDLFTSDGSGQAAPNDAFAALAPVPADLAARMVGELQSLLAGPSIQVRCLECPPPAVAAPVSRAKAGLWASMVSRLLG